MIRGTKGSRKVTLTEEGMILKNRAEEILALVKKTENEIILSDSIIIGDVYIGAAETDRIHFLAKAAKKTAERLSGYSLSYFQWQLPLCDRTPGTKDSSTLD